MLDMRPHAPLESHLPPQLLVQERWQVHVNRQHGAKPPGHPHEET